MSVEGEKTSESVPRHLAIIMDGNGRWARDRGLARLRGHEEGANSIRDVTEECVRVGGIRQLTYYALSYDNYHKRPRREIRALFRLFSKYLREELPTVMEKNIRFTTIGEIEEFPQKLQEQIAHTVNQSASNTGMTVCLALNYSARREITHAARDIARLVKGRKLSLDQITVEHLSDHLFTAGTPDVDLLIRTGGDVRVSDFLLWQISYAEIYVSKVYWPDFRKRHLRRVLDWFAGRQRRFGAVRES